MQPITLMTLRLRRTDGGTSTGHWISLYSARWTDGTAPAPELRTMTRDAPARLPDDLPNARTQSMGFMWRLFQAWVRMGFRNPPVADVRRTLNA